MPVAMLYERSLPMRIRHILAHTQDQQLHFKAIARILEHPHPRRVNIVCIQMAGRGQLAWIKPGIYRLVTNGRKI